MKFMTKIIIKDKCDYMSAIVLGLNDALVELTGALAGFTMALQNNKLIALAGLTTGIAATLSMAAAEFLSQEAVKNKSHPYKKALFTGIAYLVTVFLLLIPYFICEDPFSALIFCLFIAAMIIMAFTFVCSRISGRSFLHDFLQMFCVSLIVAAIAFLISWLARYWWNIDI